MNQYERMMKNKKGATKKGASKKGAVARRKVGNYFQYNYTGSVKKGHGAGQGEEPQNSVVEE